MKVFIAVIFVVGSVTAGSGPYLPSGWRPTGPSFYLPSEIQQLPDVPQKEILFQESEASGSEALREYGPPKLDESPLQITRQGLPDTITEQSFLILTKSGDFVSVGEEGLEGNTEQKAVPEAIIIATESQEAIVEGETTLNESQPTSEAAVEATSVEIQPTFDTISLDAQPTFQTTSAEVQRIFETTLVEAEPTFATTSVEAQSPLDTTVTEVQPTSFEVVSTIEDRTSDVADQTSEVEQTSAVSVEEVENVAAGVRNIVEALENLEKEVKVAEVQAVEGFAEVKLTQETSGSVEQVPEGFLEYGPPGFREYGPPKQEDILRSAAVQVTSDALNTNEVRRRRYSPKFRSSRKH